MSHMTASILAWMANVLKSRKMLRLLICKQGTRWPVSFKVLPCLSHVAWFKQCNLVLTNNLWKQRYLGFTSLHCLNHVASTNRKPGLTKVPGLVRFIITIPAFSSGLFITIPAFCWLFSTMLFQMCPQMTCLRWCKVTLLAFVWLFPTVCYQMCP